MKGSPTEIVVQIRQEKAFTSAIVSVQEAEALRDALDVSISEVSGKPSNRDTVTSFLKWFETFIGKECYAEIECKAMDDLRAIAEGK